MSFLANPWIFIPLFGACVFMVVYNQAPRIIEHFYKKTIETQEIVFTTLEKMFVDVNKKQMTILLLLCSYGLGVLTFVALWPDVVPGIIMGVIVTLIGIRLPKIYVEGLWEAHSNKVVNQMLDGMTMMANGVKAGLSVTQSMERVTENVKGPLSKEFNLVLNKIRLGMTVEDALKDFGDRVQRQDTQMFVTSINILKETGGNLSETFETINNTIRERQKIEKKIDAMTAQGLMQGIIMTAVPFVLMLVFLAIDPNYIKPLFTKPLGWVALIIMFGLQIMGGIAIKKIVNIKV